MHAQHEDAGFRRLFPDLLQDFDAVPVRQGYIQHRYIPSAFPYLPYRLGAALRFANIHDFTALHEDLPQALPNDRMVVDYENIHDFMPGCTETDSSRAIPNGIDRCTEVPRPGIPLTVNLPSRRPARSIIPRMPKELSLEVSAGVMPQPLSRTSSCS